MAYVHQEYCRTCNAETLHCNDKCTICAKNENQKRIDAWNALPVDEKLNNLRARIEVLERGTILDG